MGTITIQTSNNSGFISKIVINGDKKRIFVNTNGAKNFSLEYEGCSMTYTDDTIIYEFFRKEETSQVVIELTGTDNSDKMRIVLPISVKSLWPKTDFRFECGKQMGLIESELNKLVTCDTLFIVDDVVETKHKKKEILPFEERILGIKPTSYIMENLITDGFKVDLKYSPTESKTIDVVGLTTDHDKFIDFYDYIIRTVDGDRIDVVFDKRNLHVRFHGIPGVGYKQFYVCRKYIDKFEKMTRKTYDLFKEYESCTKLITGSKNDFFGIRPVSLSTRYLETNGFEVELKYSPTKSKIVDVVELKTDHDELNDYYDYRIRTFDDYVIDAVFDKQKSCISFHNIPCIGTKKIVVSRDDFKVFERVAQCTHHIFNECYKKKEMELSGTYFNIFSKIRRKKNEKKFVVAISFLPGLFLFGEITNFSKYLDERTDTLNIGIHYRNLNDVFLRVYLKEKKVIVRGANKVANAVFYFDTNGFSVLKSRINSVESSFRKYKIDLMK